MTFGAQIAYAVMLQFCDVPAPSSSSALTVTLLSPVSGISPSRITWPGAPVISALLPSKSLPVGQGATTLLLDELDGLVALTSSSPAGAGAQITNACRYHVSVVPA